MVCFLVAALPAAGQDTDGLPRAGALNLFVDCRSDCDLDFVRTQITIVNHVRERLDADIHVLIVDRSTAAGGTEHDLRFIGLRRFAGIDQTLGYIAPQSATADEQRRGLVETLKRGLVRYLIETTLADRVLVEFRPPPALDTSAEDVDPWNLWVFAVNASGSIGGERSNHGGSMRASLSANRTTDLWKATVFTSTSYRSDTFRLNETDTFTSVSRTFDASGTIVRGFSEHWSVGLVGLVTSSTFLNYDLRLRVAPGIEYNLFPYGESTRRLWTVQYTIGGNSMDYEEETIFGKTAERLVDHRVATTLSMRQPWGSGFAEVALSQFLDDPAHFSIEALGDATVRLSKGLSLTVSANASRTQDQIFLPKSGATLEEILVRERQLATTYRYAVTFGITYAFGSVFNNVVNPRFGGGGGQMVVF